VKVNRFPAIDFDTTGRPLPFDERKEEFDDTKSMQTWKIQSFHTDSYSALQHHGVASVTGKWYTGARIINPMDPTTIHVLFVDDDADYVTVVQHQLHTFAGKKFELTWLNDGEKAITHLKTEKKPDLIIMDYYLPNTNGIGITKRLSEEGFSIPIILLTSNKDFRTAIEAMKFGIEEYLVKEDITDTILPRTIINVLERVNLKRQIEDAEKEKLLSVKKTEAIQELVVTMCHEFNNPLAAIKISSDILSRQKISEEERQLVQRLNVSISQLEKQIIRLRDLNSAGGTE